MVVKVMYSGVRLPGCKSSLLLSRDMFLWKLLNLLLKQLMSLSFFICNWVNNISSEGLWCVVNEMYMWISLDST